MRLIRRVARMREMRNAYKVSVAKKYTQGCNHFEDFGTDGRIILKREIISSHCDDYEDNRLLRCDTV
jgi:hypothetical protein